ncbi:MAG: hypothetical protein FWD17_12230, partial [Polyangiaceae bacterium]|nr:hypothetical protein [Polyangiaceae bacterium]
MRFLHFARLSPWNDGAPLRLRSRRRWRQRALAALGGFSALCTLGAAAAATILHSLDRPWVKAPLVRFVRARTGLDVDYRAARVDLFSGLVIDDLIVQSPAEVRALAPHLLRVGHVEAHWSLGSVLGHGPAIERVTVSDVALSVVMDERGRTSFDALPPSAPAPPVPLSHELPLLLAGAAPVGRLDVDRVTLAFVRSDRGAVVETTDLRGLALTMVASPAGLPVPAWRAKATLGTEGAPVELELVRKEAGARASLARAKLWMTLGATPSALTAAIDLRMLEQSFAERVSADHWLHAEANARFDEARGQTEVTLDRIEAGDAAATAEASIVVPDGGQPVVRRARVDADVARLLSWLPPGLVPVTAERAHVRADADSLVATAGVHALETGSLAIGAEVASLRLSPPWGPVDVGRATFSLHSRPAQGGGVAVGGSAAIDAMQLGMGGANVSSEDVAVDLEGQPRPDGSIDGRLAVRAARFEQTGATPVTAKDGRVELVARGLRPGSGDPLTTQGDIALTTDWAWLDVRSAAVHATAEGVALRAHTALDGHAPYGAEVDASGARLRVLAADGRDLFDGAAHVTLRGRDVHLDRAALAASRGTVSATVDAGDVHASLDAN